MTSPTEFNLGFLVTEEMLNKEKKKMKNFQVELPIDDATTPFIFRTEEEGTGVSWGQAKKLLRSWYLNEAKKLRTYSEKEFNKQEQALIDKETKVEPVSSPV